MTKRRLTNTWTIFFAMVFGVVLLLISARPDLQPRRGHENAAGPNIALVGHLLTWSTAAVLGYRMVRSFREPEPTSRRDRDA